MECVMESLRYSKISIIYAVSQRWKDLNGPATPLPLFPSRLALTLILKFYLIKKNIRCSLSGCRATPWVKTLCSSAVISQASSETIDGPLYLFLQEKVFKFTGGFRAGLWLVLLWSLRK